MPLLSFYSDIIASLAAACVLSLFTGWMLHKSKTRKQLDATTRYWEQRYGELENMARHDSENLEEQLQSMATDAKALQMHNQMLNDSIKSNENSAQRSRAEAIELNRQHAESQERLQRIIQQKEREILELGSRVNQYGMNPGPGNSSGKGASTGISAFSTAADDTDILGDDEMTHADTVAINTADLFDATIQMSARELLAQREETRSDEELESTIVINSPDAIDIQEATVALDEDVLAFARRSSKPNRND